MNELLNYVGGSKLTALVSSDNSCSNSFFEYLAISCMTVVNMRSWKALSRSLNFEK